MEILKKEEDVLNHMSHAILDENIELEIIFGYNQYKNPIDKKIFLKLLNKFKVDYILKYENISLDIRCRYDDTTSTTRCTISDLQSIMKYCNSNSLENIEEENLVFIKKNNFRSSDIKSNIIQNRDYNYRLTLKTELDLQYNNKEILHYNNIQNISDKHFRYKKRYSFETSDKLFRIDLSVVKSTLNINDKIQWAKTFKDANILNNPEQYELEIEYIGSSEKNKEGIYLINDFYNKLERGIENPIQLSGSIFNPLNVVISDMPEDISPEKESSEYMKQSIIKVTDTKEPFKLQLLGKNIKIKDKFFVENEQYIYLKNMIEKDKNILITVMDYDENYNDKNNKSVLIKIDLNENNLELQKLYGILKNEYPEHFLKDFKHKDYKPKKRKLYLELVKKISEMKYEKIEIWISITNIYSDTFDIDKAILDYYSPIVEKSGGGGLSSEDELLFNEDKKNILADKCIEILNNHLLYIFEIIHDTKLILTFNERKKILDKFKALYKQKSYRLSDYVPQPVTLNYENLLLNSDINILKGYAVTEKADGIRCLLYIIENTGYLITSTMNIIYTGVKFPNVNGEWLLDGEYITKNKQNQNIKLYMIFDIYRNGNMTPDYPHMYPWKVKSSKKHTREKILKNFKDLMSEQIHDKLEHIRIGIKEYKYGADKLSDPNEEPDKFKKETKSIFNKCKEILNKEELFEYNIDGLILLPIYLGVKGDIMNKSPKFIGGSWNYNFKWKPQKENTIDFKVITEKEGNKDKIYPLNDDNGILRKYKKLNIYVNYRETDDDSIDFIWKLLRLDKLDISKTKLFNPSDDNVNSTKILLEDNKMLCDKDKSEIKDGDIVEMRYVKDDNDIQWIPLRVRHDKIIPNAMKTANNVWKTIINPITDELMRGEVSYDMNKIIELSEKKGDTGYYISEGRSAQTTILTAFHNYIKSNLISGVCTSIHKQVNCLDLSCGRGGDIKKYINPDNNVIFLLGLDIEDVNEASKRFYFEKRKPLGIFLQADTSKNIKNKVCCESNEHSKYMIDILYGLSKTFPERYVDNGIYKRYKEKAKQGFDLISSQFTLHYYLENEEKFNGFLNNISENINDGGYFIATFYDGSILYELLKEQDKLEYKDEDDNLIYKIEKKFTEIDTDFKYEEGNNSNMFGNEISVYMDSIGKEFNEYLVNLDFLIASMKERKLELVTPKPNKKYSNIFSDDCMIKKGHGSFANLIKKLPKLKKDLKDKKYDLALDITKNKELQLLSGLNVYMIFQKK